MNNESGPTGLDETVDISTSEDESAIDLMPWEQPGRGHWLARWWETCWIGLWRPKVLYRSLRNGSRLGPAMRFFALCLLVDGVVAPAFKHAVLGSTGSGILNSDALTQALNRMGAGTALGTLDGLASDSAQRVNLPGGSTNQALELLRTLSGPATKGGAVLTAVSTGMLGLAGLLLVAAVFQIGAVVFVRNRHPFSETLAAVAYAHVAVVWTVVPVVGWLVYAIWLTITLPLSLREAHHTTTGRAVLALSLVPIVAMVILTGACVTLLGSLLPSIPL